MPNVSGLDDWSPAVLYGAVHTQPGDVRPHCQVCCGRMETWRECRNLGERLEWARENALKFQSRNQLQGFIASLDEDERPTGQTRKAIGNYEKGTRTPQADYVAFVVSHGNIDGHWLLTGEGSPDRKPDSDLRMDVVRRVLSEDSRVVEAMRDAILAQEVTEDLGETEGGSGGA